MRIVHAIRTTRLKYGGPARSALDLVQSLGAVGHEVTLITACARDVPEGHWRELASVVEVRTWPGERGFIVPQGMRTVKEVLRRADVLHLHEVWEIFNLQIAGIARRIGLPYCVSPRGSLDDWSTRQKGIRKAVFHRLASSRVLEGAAIIHCTADREALESGRWLGDIPTEVLPNLIELSMFRQLPGRGIAMRRFGIGEEDQVLLFLSRLQPGKGLLHCIRAMPDVLRRCPRSLLIVAGDGSADFRREAERETRRLGVEQRVRFVGFAKDDLRTSLFQCANMLLLPSDHENFGNALFEAAACGVPLLVSPGVATAATLEAAGAAVTVPPDPAEIADAVVRHLQQPAEMHEIRRAGIREWALGYLDNRRVVEGYLAAYRRALAPRESERDA